MDENLLAENPQALAAYFCDLKTREEQHFISAPRASQLYRDCMRQLVLGTKLERRVRSKVSFHQRVTFMIGNAVHDWIQNTEDLFGNYRRGWWACSACEKFIKWDRPPSEEWKCPECGAGYRAARYEEHSIALLKPLVVNGHPDLFIRFKNKTRLVELKTINGKDFEKLFLPKIDHVWQVLTYLWALKYDPVLKDKVDREKAYICYLSKRSGYGQFPLKMFHVEYNHEILLEILRKLNLYKQGIENGKLPPLHGECQRKNRGARAGECSVRFECFQEHRHES